MKRFMAAVLLVMLMASASFAKVRDFGDFTIDLPVGWEMEKSTDGSMYVIDKIDGTGGFMLGLAALEGKDIGEAVNEFAAALHGTKPRYDEKTGEYSFLIHENGKDVRGRAARMEDEDVLVVLVWTGVSQSQMEEIVGSVKFKK